MASLNQCSFIGNLGKDPEVRMTQAGKKVASFSIACSKSWKGQDGQKQERTEWIPVVAWDPLAGVCERFLRKGSKVFVQGEFTTRSWDNDQGVKQYKTEIQVREMVLLDKRDGQSQPAGNGSAASLPPNYNAADDDMPF